NIATSQEFNKLSDLTEMVALTNQEKYLKEKRKQLLEIVHYCECKFKCRQQIAYQIFAWLRDPDIPECHNCDNCCQHPKLLRISRDDIADCFMGSKEKNAISKDLSSVEGYGIFSESSIFNEDCLYLIDSLILLEIITEKVEIKYSKEITSLSYSSSLVGLKENALDFVTILDWKLLIKASKK
ncbi:13528_t:CDS:2, partial [Racocetra fulgida]